MADQPVDQQRPLLERFPRLCSHLPFEPLGVFPTPVRRLTALQEELAIQGLWIKNDDLSALDYGGNKIRKLEFLLADALNRGCSTVLTFGGLGSNHALATSINCKRLGLHCVAVLTPEPPTEAVRRTLLYHQLLGTQIEVAQRYNDALAAAARVTSECGANNVYEVPFGGSSWVGATGFVNAALELDEQIKAQLLPQPEVIYIGLGTAGSAAGLALGLRLAGRQIPIEAVQVTPDSIAPGKLYAELYVETSRELNALDPAIPLLKPGRGETVVRHDQLGEGYAIPTSQGHEAARLLLETEAVTSSLTYTAKTLAALIADARAGRLQDRQALFWNTYNSRPYPDVLPANSRDGRWQDLPAELHFLFADQRV